MDNEFSQLNEDQIKPVLDINGNILVIAGAGSGKTKVLTARITYLLQMGVDPQNILAITFTNKAAEEMKQRICNSNPMGELVWASTFHSMCTRILRRFGSTLGYDTNFTIYDEEDRENALKRVIKLFPEGYLEHSSDYFLTKIREAKRSELNPIDYCYIHNFESEVIEVIQSYEKELCYCNALDFDDLLIKCYDLLKNNKDVLDYYQELFHYIHVDEFQDTNDIQLKLVALLSQKYSNLFVVGDEDQAIYSWRGSIIDHIVDFKRYFPNSKIYKLEQNYRSTPEILNAANNVIRHNCIRNPKKLWTENISNPKSVIYIENEDNEDEAKYVSTKIQDLHKSGIPYRQIAVLIRFTALSRVLEFSFNSNNIPFKVFGGFKFYERKEIKDTLAYVNMIVNKKDNNNIIRIINYPRRKIGATTISQLIELSQKNNTSLFETIVNIDKYDTTLKNKLKSFITLINDFSIKINQMSPSDFITYVVKESGIEEDLSNSLEKEDDIRLENIKELIQDVDNYFKRNPKAKLSDYLQNTTLLTAADEATDDEYVSIATIHAVKGLEFNTVFICGCVENLFPYKKSIDNPKELEEERRLMYVAITRAKKQVIVSTYGLKYYNFETKKYERIGKSRFINEMKSNSYSNYNNSSNIVYENGTTFIRKNHGYSIQSNYPQQNTPVKPQPKPVLKTQPPKQPVDLSKFKPNVKVEHVKFGNGIITEVIGNGDEMSIKIEFKGLGILRFVASIVAPNLKIIE